jgi:hypothetical protein
MSIRPVDLQILMQRAVEINKTEQGEGRRPEVAHQQFSQIIQKQTEEESHQVLRTNKSEHEPIDKDGKGGNQYERRKKGKGKGDGKGDGKEKGTGTGMFDISV